MKFTVFTDELKSNLAKVTRLLPAKPNLPILENIHFYVDEGNLTLSVTDLEIGIKTKVIVKTTEDGVLTIPGKQINEYISALSDEKVDIETQDDVLTTTSESSTATFTGIDAKEFPELPRVDAPLLTRLPKTLLNEAASYVAFSASTDINRPVLTGMLIILEDGVLSFVATDGYRLSIKTFEVEATGSLQVVVPTRFIVEASRLFASSEEDAVELLYDEQKSLILMRSAESELSSRLIEGTFPPYKSIIPSAFVTKTLVNKEDLIKDIRVIGVFAKDSGNIVKVTFSAEKGIEFASNSTQVGSSRAHLGATVEGETLEVAFNIRYLNDFLSSCKSSQVSIELTGPIKPTLFQEVGNDSYKHIIMPVKLQT